MSDSLQRLTWESAVIRGYVTGHLTVSQKNAALMIAELVDWTNGDYPQLKYSRAKAAHMLRMSRPKLSEALKELTEAGWLEQRWWKDDSGEFHHNFCPVAPRAMDRIAEDWKARRDSYTSTKSHRKPEPVVPLTSDMTVIDFAKAQKAAGL